MKTARFAVVLFAMLLGSANLLHAQTCTGQLQFAAVSAPDLSKLNVSTALQTDAVGNGSGRS